MAGEYDAAIAAASQAASQAMNTASAANANKKERQWMAEQSQLNWERQNEMWNKTNNFNLMVSDPAFQMQRLKQAGLSPWTMAGVAPAKIEANTMNAPAPQSHEYKREPQDYAKTMQTYLGIKMAQKQLENVDAQTQSSLASARNQNSLSNLSDFTLSKEQQMLPGALQGQGLSNTGTDLGNKNLAKTGNVLDLSVNKLNAEIETIGIQQGKTQQEITNLKQAYTAGIIDIQNKIKAGQYQEAQTRALEIGNQIIEATSKSKIDAENAKNELIRDTKGLSEKGMQNLPSVLTGQMMDAIDQIGKRRNWWKTRLP